MRQRPVKLPVFKHAMTCGWQATSGKWRPIAYRPLWRKLYRPLLHEEYRMCDGATAHYTTCAICGKTRSLRIDPTDGKVTVLEATSVFGEITNEDVVTV